ncbi:MAG: glycoside hydrolase family 88 protein [Enterocloster sp.]
MKEKFEISELELKNVIVSNDYVLECQPYEYIFFKIPDSVYGQLEAVEIDLAVDSQTAEIVLNEYLPNKPVVICGSQSVRFDISECESGENMLAYKGKIRIKEIRFLPVHQAPDGEQKEEKRRTEKQKTQLLERKEAELSGGREIQASVQAAASYLLHSRISQPDRSQFCGSCYAIYDYTNECYRMSCWLWSDAPVAYSLLELEKLEKEPEKKAEYGKLAMDIGKVFLNSQVKEPEDEVCGALLSRYRYYGKSSRSFHRLLGPNDTSYSVKWALLPLYERTKDRRYLEASRSALDWIEKTIYKLDFIPSHYYYEDKLWEDRAFVDTAFCVEGFEQYQKIAGDRNYTETMDYLMRRFIKQFKLETGYFGQNYFPEKGVDDRLFTRGHAWVLEGLLSCCRSIGGEYYRKETEALCRKLAQAQREDGAWSYLLGYGVPDKRIMDGSGICEKATAILAYLFLEYYRLYHDEEIYRAALAALEWCERSMVMDPGPGFGGIVSESLSSGITGLPFLRVATGYANAYYILAELLKEKIAEKKI